MGSGSQYLRTCAVQSRPRPSPLALAVAFTVSWAARPTLSLRARLPAVRIPRGTVIVQGRHLRRLWAAVGSGSRYLRTCAVQTRPRPSPLALAAAFTVSWAARPTLSLRARLPAVRIPRGTVIVQGRHLLRLWATVGAVSRYLRVYTVQTRPHSSPIVLTFDYTVSWAVRLTAVALCRPVSACAGGGPLGAICFSKIDYTCTRTLD